MSKKEISTEYVYKIMLSKYDFDISNMTMVEAINKFQLLYNEGNYVDACDIAREFMFKFAVAKHIEDELMVFVSTRQQEIPRVDTSVADFKE